ncbi:hypothetical protein GE061_005436 [Apolygus lucorum]|uniref:Uncharacterized protein n=1 Tax=Apolygus lucorum TaxID=248454 RepID=A0A8S9WXP1_APOLU|nr:hypothetical protein GE061_005436 [Apolygus lucorum]
MRQRAISAESAGAGGRSSFARYGFPVPTLGRSRKNLGGRRSSVSLREPPPRNPLVASNSSRTRLVDFSSESTSRISPGKTRGRDSTRQVVSKSEQPFDYPPRIGFTVSSSTEFDRGPHECADCFCDVTVIPQPPKRRRGRAVRKEATDPE